MDEIAKAVTLSLKIEMDNIGHKHVEIVPVGSAVKGTNLADNSDIDIFVKFPPKIPVEAFKGKIHEAMKNAVESIGATSETNYASHPYIHAKLDGIDIDVCPCYDVPDGKHIISAVD